MGNEASQKYPNQNREIYPRSSDRTHEISEKFSQNLQESKLLT